jgi:hypothetical protein
VINEMLQYLEGFEIENDFDRNYALYFKDATQSKDLRENWRALIVDFPHNPMTFAYHRASHYDQDVDPYHVDEYFSFAFSDFWSALGSYGAVDGYVVRVEDGMQKHKKHIAGFRLLLPVDYSKFNGKYGSLLMRSSFGTNDLIGNPTYDAAVVNSMHD